MITIVHHVRERVAMETVFTSHLGLKFHDLWNQATTEQRTDATKEVVGLFDEYKTRVTLRGAYVTRAFRADTDLFLWMYSKDVDVLQDLHFALRRTRLGRSTHVSWSFVGMTHEAEFNPDHIPAFMKNIPPKNYLCFYPYIRTADWYLLPHEERRDLLREHGEVGKRFPEVLTNGVYHFGLGDYEWLLSFESDHLDRIVEMMRSMRATEARRFTKHEWPFIVGRRYDIREALEKYV